MKNDLDEMQEKKLLKVEHHACWIGFWGLTAAIYIQQAIGILTDTPQNTTGETIVLLVMSAYIIIRCISNGIWDRKLKPNMKTNTIISVSVSVAVALFQSIITYAKYQKLLGSIGVFVFMSCLLFVLMMLVFGISVSLYRRKTLQLEKLADQDERED